MKIYAISASDIKKMHSSPQNRTSYISNLDAKANLATKNLAKICASYNAPNISFGSRQKFVREGVDALRLKITDKAKKAASVSIKVISESINKEEKIVNDKKTMVPKIITETLTSSSRDSEGFFDIPISAVDRKDNSFLRSIKTSDTMFFDANDNLLHVSKDSTSINPIELFAQKPLKKFIINGNERFSDLDVYSSASTMGVIKRFDDYTELKNYKGDEPVFALITSSHAKGELLYDSTQDDFILPSNIKGIITKKEEKALKFFVDCLSHAQCRLNGKQAFVDAGAEVFDEINSTYPNGQLVKVIAKPGGLSISLLDKITPKIDNKVVLDPIKMATGLLTETSRGFVPEAVGIKAYNLGKLHKISKEGGFETPRFFAIQAGEFDAIKDANPLIFKKNEKDLNKKGLYFIHSQLLDTAYDTGVPIDSGLEAMQCIIKKDMQYPQSFIERLQAKVQEVFGFLPAKRDLQNPDSILTSDTPILSVRSSFPNFEDLEKVSTQGMFDSVGGVRTFDELLPAIKKVWASKWGEVAYKGRREHSIPHDSVQPAVLVQDFIKDVDYVFTAYTKRIEDPDELLIELSQGASVGLPGNSYIYTLNRKTGDIKRMLMATKGRRKDAQHFDLRDKANKKYALTNYSTDPLNMSHDDYAPIIKKITEPLLFIEKHFGNVGQDIEGGIKFSRDKNGMATDIQKTYIWQTRNVQMPQ